MKLRNTALNALFYFLYMLGACIVTMLAEALLIFMAEKFVHISYPVLTVVRDIIYTVGVLAILAAIGYFEGYREGTCPVGETVAGGTVAVLPHLILALLFGFQAFVAGGARYTAGLLYCGKSISAEALEKTPDWVFLAVFLGYGVLYVATLTIARYLGAQKRVIDRAELRRDERFDSPTDTGA